MGLLAPILFGAILSTASGWHHALVGSRREFANAAVAAGWSALVLSPEASFSAVTTTATSPPGNNNMGEATGLSSRLLTMIPTMDFGAPATNATIPNQASLQIEDFASLMERAAATTTSSDQKSPTLNNAVSEKLSGSWRLLYSNAPEIRSLAKGLPLGFRLGPTYQPLDASLGFFENRARLDHPYKLAVLQTIVVGTVKAGTKGSLNAVGIENRDNNRVDIDFDRIVFQLDEILGKTLDKPVRKTLVPATKSTGDSRDALPANDQTYLDDKVRIVRGGDGSLFIFSRVGDEDPEPSVRMMTANERDELFASSDTGRPGRKNGFFVESFDPLGEEPESEQRHRQQEKSTANVPVEIKFLLKEMK